MKYVRHEKLGIFLFPDAGGRGIIHKDMHDFILDYILEGKIISAGFARFENGYFICYGYSQSINLGGLKDDSKTLNKQFNIK